MKDLLEITDHQLKERPVSMGVILSTFVQLYGFRGGVGGQLVFTRVAKKIKVKYGQESLEFGEDWYYNDRP